MLQISCFSCYLMVVLLYLKKQEETAHYIIHIMWYRGEYMGCENLAGMKFAHLLVLKRDEMKKSTHSYWLCQCDCGTICSVAGTHLKTGHTKSCGCYRKRKQVHGWLDLTGKRYGRLQVLGPWEKHSPLLEVVKEGESSVEEGLSLIHI